MDKALKGNTVLRATLAGQPSGGSTVQEAQLSAEPTSVSTAQPGQVLIIAAVLLASSFLWAYWTTIVHLVGIWNSVADYSHGFLVPILAVCFLWLARDRFPGLHLQLAWPGLLLIVISLLMRIPAGYLYIPTIDAWSIPVWIIGVVWTFGGWRLARWSLPAALYLYFMVPLPFRMERWLSVPLRSTATNLSVWTLQCLGQPAIAEGYTIHLGAHRLEVEQACSGLRMLVGIAALAVAYLIITRRTWWERALLLASVLPVALAANTARIVGTGMLYHYVSIDAGHKFAHDFAGWAMILLAAGLFAGVLWYVDRLFPERKTIDVSDLLLNRSD